MKKRLLFVCLLCAIVSIATNAQTYSVKSPNQTLTLQVSVSNEEVTYAVNDAVGVVLAPSHLAMQLNRNLTLGKNAKLLKQTQRSVRDKVSSPFYKKSEIDEQFNEIALSFKGGYKIVFRVFDQGVAYRFETAFKDSIIVENEIAQFRFAEDCSAYVPYVSTAVKEGEPMDAMFSTSFENQYKHQKLSEMDSRRLAFLPLLVELPLGRKVVITESDLRNYPGMYLLNKKLQDNQLDAVYAPRPKHWTQGGHNNLQYCVDQHESYIAKTAGTRTFPWRIVTVSQQDKELANNDLVYLLATPSKVSDLSWIKPGKVAWDWWNNWNISGVDFRAGINNETYQYYINFAADNGIGYVILDEGWAVNGKADLMQVVPEIDLPHLAKYAKERNVGLVLWAGYAAMDCDMERVCKHYAEMGIKGFKVDFMDRDDQIVVDFYERMAATAAKYHLFVDFHGSYKPTGLSRTYPNVLNYEGVFGQEQCKWVSAEYDMVTYDVTIPFIRMLAGPLDYTPGAMKNAAKYCFAPVWSDPMSQGTRCHQLAEYVVFDAPFSMLCDAPTAYMKEQECLEFIASVPTVWDETRILDAKVGEYVITARRSGTTWYIGALNNWEKRSFDLDLSTLTRNAETVTIYKDGINADRKGSDYRRQIVPFTNTLHLDVAPGGGAVAVIRN